MQLELKERIQRLKTLHLQAASSFVIYEKIQEYRAPNLLGKELAEKHKNDLGYYRGFMNITEKALNTELHITLAKMFDNHNLALHIDVLVRLAKEGQAVGQSSGITDRETEKLFRGLSKEEWADLEAKIDAQRDQINRLKRIRNTEVAHIDLEKPTNNKYLTYEELNGLIELSGEVLQILSFKFLRTSLYDGMYIEQVQEDTDKLLALISSSEDERKAALRRLREEQAMGRSQ